MNDADYRQNYKMYILGISAYHGDSSAAFIVDGKLISAAEEDRFRRIKHWAGLPTESIRYCSAKAGITLSNLDGIAINQDSKTNLEKYRFYRIALVVLH